MVGIGTDLEAADGLLAGGRPVLDLRHDVDPPDEPESDPRRPSRLGDPVPESNPRHPPGNDIEPEHRTVIAARPDPGQCAVAGCAEMAAQKSTDGVQSDIVVVEGSGLNHGVTDRSRYCH